MATEHPDKLLQVAVALERMSEHPIGSAIVRAVQKQGGKWIEAVNILVKPGQGISGEVEGKIAVVGKAAFVQTPADNCPQSLVHQSQKWEQEGKTVVWVAHENRILGIIAVADTVRATAALGRLSSKTLFLP